MNLRAISCLLPVAVSAGFLVESACAQTTWHVATECTPPGSGSAADPFCTIQQGINAAQDGDTVLVAPGTYTGTGNRDISLFGKAITLRSVEGAETTIIDVEGGPGAIHRGFYLIHGETAETVIEGFTITNGYLIGDTGGVGTGTPGGGGGAIMLRDSSPLIQRCIMTNNTSADDGNPLVFDGIGGAVYVDGGSEAIVESCTMFQNTSEKRGGGMYIGFLQNSALTVQNCLIVSNSASNGGGIHNRAHNTIVRNTVIVGNTSEFGGGGFNSEQVPSILINTIMLDNTAGTDGPQLFASGPGLSVSYSNVQGGQEEVAGCCLFELDWGPGNIDVDPLFADPAGGDYRLQPGSPCIDAGGNCGVPGSMVVDFDGFSRFADDPATPDTGQWDGLVPVVDIGPFEFGAADCNLNQIPDAEDVAGGSADCDNNDVPDECQRDCNANGQADTCDLAAGLVEDCNGNGTPDECEIALNSPAWGGPFFCDPDLQDCAFDCNHNATPDECDIAAGSSEDCNDNGIPDECDDNLPAFSLHPQDAEVSVGGVVFFLVEVEGVTAIHEFTWRRNGTPLIDSGHIVGSQTSTLAILDVQPADVGVYDCVITNVLTGCSTVSESAVLIIAGQCPGDFNGDGLINAVDLAPLLGAWGPNPPEPLDLNGDGTVNPADLAQLLGAWGACEE